MRAKSAIVSALFIFAIVLLTGCATSPQQAQIQRISPQELERIMPRPVPNLPLDEIVRLSKAGTSPELIIEKIKATNSRYDLTPSQSVGLSQQGVSAQVLDYIHASHEAAVRDNFADEINRREQNQRREQDRLRREYEYRYQPYYDPFWNFGYGYAPYWGYAPYYGFGFRYHHRW